jgi:hypothetical protein
MCWLLHHDRRGRRIAGAYVLARAAKQHQWLGGNSIRTASDIHYCQPVRDLDVGTAHNGVCYRHKPASLIGAGSAISLDHDSDTTGVLLIAAPFPRPLPFWMTSAARQCSRRARCSFRFTQRHACAQAKLPPFPAKKTTAGMPRRASVTGDRRSRIHRTTGSHVPPPHRTAPCTFVWSRTASKIEV